MLDKDQYNQEDYNNYYKQESEGAEIKGFTGEESSLKSKLIIFAGLIGLAIAGYFGFKMLNTPDTVNSSTPTEEKLATNEEPAKEESSSGLTSEENPTHTPVASEILVEKETETQTIKEKVASQIQEKADNTKDMSDQDISKIVDLVMSKMEKSQTGNTKEDVDNALMSALQETEEEHKPVKKVSEIKTNTVVHEMKKVTDSYNKVTVKATPDKNLDELSDQIRKLLNMAGEPVMAPKTSSSSTTAVSQVTKNNDNSNYTQSISQEIETRSKEMRIIVVKPGDTLNKIAKRAYGNSKSFQKIFDANPDILNRADRIYVGQKLRIPE